MIGHLLCGLILGWLAAVAAFALEYSIGSMLGWYALGANLGLVLSVLWSLGLRGGTGWIARWAGLGEQARQSL